MKGYIVTTLTPDGKTRQREVAKIREAGQIVAWTLADNLLTDRKTATKLAMQAEKQGGIESHGYTFVIQQATKEEVPA
jgi:hypothetical protein